MCIVVHMKSQQKLELYHELKTVAAALRFRASKRVQLKMPRLVVELLDKEFPHQSRSKIITEAAVELLLRKLRIDDPTLEHWVAEQQHDLDRMWAHLEEREKK